jgi:tRNA(fMet)-specific endonuclease VapC
MTCYLDSNVIIALMKNLSPVVAVIRSKPSRAIKVSEVVRAELIYGCLNSADPPGEQAKVDLVLSPFELIPFAGDAVEHYGSIRLHLARKGKMIGSNDLLIAATSRALGAVMVTANEGEYSQVPGPVVENWA